MTASTLRAVLLVVKEMRCTFPSNPGPSCLRQRSNSSICSAAAQNPVFATVRPGIRPRNGACWLHRGPAVISQLFACVGPAFFLADQLRSQLGVRLGEKLVRGKTWHRTLQGRHLRVSLVAVPKLLL